MGSSIWNKPLHHLSWPPSVPLLLVLFLVSATWNCRKSNAFVVHHMSAQLSRSARLHDTSSTNANKRDLLLFADATLEETTPTDASARPQDTADTEAMQYDPSSQDTAFHVLCGNAAICLIESEKRRDAVGSPSGTQASSATNWINDATAFALQKAMDKMSLKGANERTGLDRDEASTWIRWMKSTPAPLMIDLSGDFRAIVNSILSDAILTTLDVSRDDFLGRMGCRLLLLPSGASLPSSLTEPPASIIYGKLLYGGITRYRWLVSSNSQRPPRRAGERTEVMASVKDQVPVWMQYGGPDRMYEAVDMGGAAVLELLLFPRGQMIPDVLEQSNNGGMMAMSRLTWSLTSMLGFVDEDDKNYGGNNNTELIGEETLLLGSTPMSLSGKDRNDAFASDFRVSVGGLSTQIEAIVRRVLDGRVIRPADASTQQIAQDETTAELAIASLEAEELALLGLTPVKGLLLFGPPGTGKTLLAREISRSLRARSPKIVSAPELLDRWVGGSEKLVRALFADAEAELAACNGDATKSALHVVVIDEIDAVFRKRTAAEDSGEATRASAVNQILAKLDGVNAIPNVLLIGMTNRRELLDDALLRPGRLEVQIEVPLPDREGRREILQIHFDSLRRKGRLSKPLCCAIDGVVDYNEVTGIQGLSLSEIDDDNSDSSSNTLGERKRDKFKRALKRIVTSSVRGPYDLAADYATAGFSGADIAGMVRCAGSLALARARKDGNGVDGLLITLEDAKEALIELKSG